MNELEKRAKFHKKRLKGLPRTSLNTNAGNVEHNVAMFNHINSPAEGPSNNPISGPFGGDVGTGMGESLKEKKEYIELEYPDLEFEQHGEVHWDGDYDSWDRVADWTIKVEKEDIETFLYENCIDDTDVSNWYDMTPEESKQWVKDNFDDLFEKYKELILENWIEDAIDDATANYDPDDYVDWDMMPGGHDDIDVDESIESENKKSSYEGLDDKFDMSLRTF